MPIKVLLADDREIMRRAILSLLQAQSGVEVVGEAADLAQTMQMANDLKPQVIVMDLHMPNETKVTPLDVKSHLNHGSRLVAIKGEVWQKDASETLLLYSHSALI